MVCLVPDGRLAEAAGTKAGWKPAPRLDGRLETCPTGVRRARKQLGLIMRVSILVLNFNGRRLLAECLPSVLEAARASRHDCRVAVIDNDSRDASVPWLGEQFPDVPVICRPNRGLCSFNDVLASLEAPVAVLLNNDIQLDRGAIDPLVEPLRHSQGEDGSRSFMTAPRCYNFFDGYEGFRTAVQWRWGLVQATSLFAGHEALADVPGLTASAGAALAVDRRIFLELGGFDPLYLPGRLEDLDFAFRAYMAGYRARYVPEAVAWHRGMATFGEVFGQDGCDRLALRNTLLFQWKNLRSAGSVARQALGLLVRLAWDQLRGPFAAPGRRWAFTRALGGALARLPELCSTTLRAPADPRREREFFARFHPQAMRAQWGPSANAPEGHPADEAMADSPRSEGHEVIEVYA